MRVIITAILAATCLIPWRAIGQQPSQVPNISIHQAALQGNMNAIRQYIETGSDLDARDAYGSTPLIIATTFGQTDVAKVLIEAGADLNLTDNNGSTPLQIAAFLGRTEIVRALLDKGANMYARNNSGATAFDIVAAPFDDDKGTYDQLSAALGPLGLKLDYEQIKRTRPFIAEMLRPTAEELKTVDYTPLNRDDWRVSTPARQRVNPLLMAELYFDADHMETLYSLLVIKNGYLIGEKYFNKGSINQLSKRASVTKSYVSALVGIALEKGCLSSIDQKMTDFFPEVADRITDPRKKQITIRDMLEMRAGFPWEETDSTYWNALWSGEYIPLIVDFPLVSDPGTAFHYSNLTSHWLGIIVARACKMDLKSFGQENLFAPLGVQVGDWTRDIDGYYIGGGDIQFTARDMARFGLLYLNNGQYDGKQLIPYEWVNVSLQSYSETIKSAGITGGKLGRYFHDIGYGYQWWSATAGKHHFEFAWGHGGQLIVLLKDLNMVIVVTADPFYGKEKHWKAWKYEQGNINLVGKFIKSLPAE